MYYNKDPPYNLCLFSYVHSYTLQNNNTMRLISINPFIVLTVNLLAVLNFNNLLSQIQANSLLSDKLTLAMAIYSCLVIGFNLLLFDDKAWVQSISNNLFERFLFKSAYFSILFVNSLPFLLYLFTL